MVRVATRLPSSGSNSQIKTDGCGEGEKLSPTEGVSLSVKSCRHFIDLLTPPVGLNGDTLPLTILFQCGWPTVQSSGGRILQFKYSGANQWNNRFAKASRVESRRVRKRSKFFQASQSFFPLLQLLIICSCFSFVSSFLHSFLFAWKDARLVTHFFPLSDFCILNPSIFSGRFQIFLSAQSASPKRFSANEWNLVHFK